MSLVRSAPIALLLAYAVLTHQQARVWQSELSLWRHAAQMAPLKPRPAVNYAKALMLSGQMAAAEAELARALVLAGGAHVPEYDQVDATKAVTGNLQALAIVRAVYAQ